MRERPYRDPDEADASPTPASLPEPVQLERIRAGDEAAFEQVFKSHYRALCTFVHGYVRSRETAEELVQAVFLRVWQRHERWDPAAGIRAYLFGACRNAALDHLKRRRIADRVTGSGEPDPAMAREVPAPDDAIQAEELADAVRRAIETLPERQRAVVVLRWQHELTNVEVARTLGISVKGVEAHVTRALAILRQRLAALRR